MLRTINEKPGLDVALEMQAIKKLFQMKRKQ